MTLVLERAVLRYATRQYDAYLFDCDGTLADTMPLHHAAWRQALSAHGASFDFDWELFHSRAGMTLEQTVVELNHQFGLTLPPSEVATQQRALFATMEGAVEPIQFVVDFLQHVRSFAAVAVVSGSRRLAVDAALTKIGISSLFSVVVAAEDVTRGKPAPDGFLLAASQLGIAPERCLVLEDGQYGIDAAHAARMDTLLVGREGSYEFQSAARAARPSSETPL